MRRSELRRGLRFENLQQRVVMAADLMACLPEPTPESEFSDVMESEAPMVAVEADEFDWLLAEGEDGTGGPSQTPLTVLNFDVTIASSGQWLLAGKVVFTGNHSDITVEFGLDGDGHSTGIDADGNFELLISAIANPEYEVISAKAVSPLITSPWEYADTP